MNRGCSPRASFMGWRYEYTPFIWPALACGGCMTATAIYAWRRRSVPGALLFAVTLSLCVPWALGMVTPVPATTITPWVGG